MEVWAIGWRYTGLGLALFGLIGCSNPFGAGGPPQSKIDTGHHPGAELPSISNATNSTASVSPTAVANGISTATVSITLQDVYHAPITGVVPRFSATDAGSTNVYGACSATDAQGVSSCTFTSTKAETKVVTVDYPVSIAAGSVEFVAGVPTTLTFIRQPGGGNAGAIWNSQPKLELKDQYANVISTGSDAAVPITLTLSTGTGALSGTTTLTSAAGIVDFSSAGLTINLIGNKVLTASAATSVGTLTATSDTFVIAAAAGDATNSTVSATPTSLFADGSTTSTVTVTLIDAYSNRVSGKTISLSSSRGGIDSISPASQSSNSSGVATFTVSSSSAGTPIFTAFDSTDGVTVTQTVSLTFVSYVADTTKSTVTNKPVSLAADGSTLSTITVTVKNNGGTALPNKTVSFSSDRGATDTLSAASATTDSSGVATITVKSSTRGNAAITASVAADSATLTPTATLLFLSQSPYADWQPRLATGSGPGANSSTTTLTELVQNGSNYGTLNGFAYNNSSSGWAGDGTTSVTSGATGPYRLLCDGSGSYVNFGTGMNASSNFSVETWVRPAAVASRGKVILSNGDSADTGITLRQAWDGSGKVVLHLGSQSYAETILTDSPVAYWRLGESGTTSALDSSGNSATATYTGTYTLGQSHSGWGDSDKSISLGGAGYVQTPYTQTAVTAFTVEAWIKTTDSGTKRVIFHNRGNSSTSGKSLTLGIGTTGGGHGSAGQVGFEVDSDSIDIGISSTTTVNDGNWHHVVGTWAANSGVAVAPSQFKIYIDGALASTTSGTTGSATSPLTGLDTAQIGKHVAWSTFWNGQIDEVAIYTTALSLARVQAHYAARLKTACISTSALSNNVWTFLTGAFTASGPTLELMVNGSSVCSITNSGAAYTGSTNPLSAAAQVSNPNSAVAGTYWSGAIGDIRTYQLSLTPTEASQNYNATSARFP